MPRFQALATALGMLNCPHVTTRASRSPLPEGVTFLLEIAAEEPDALRKASALTGQAEAKLKEAAVFFIEQALFSRHTDHYRTLGGGCVTPQAELRRNMALIMKWLHPDVASNRPHAHSLDRRIYVSRVTEAWEALKTEEHRAAYDAALSAGRNGKGTWNAPALREMLPQPASGDLATPSGTRRHRQLVIRPVTHDGFWSRFLLMFGGRS